MRGILIADDHPIFLGGLVALFDGSEYSIVAQCTSGLEVLDALRQVQPEILLLDINMPQPSGLEILRELKHTGQPSKIILLTSSIEDSQIRQAIRLGVDGIVLKETAPQQLMACLGTVLAGRRWFDPEVTERALDGALPNEAGEQLTARELDLVRLVAGGLRNKEIARELGISEGTVKAYLHSIYEKLGVCTRVELSNLARDRGLL